MRSQKAAHEPLASAERPHLPRSFQRGRTNGPKGRGAKAPPLPLGKGFRFRQHGSRISGEWSGPEELGLLEQAPFVGVSWICRVHAGAMALRTMTGCRQAAPLIFMPPIVTHMGRNPRAGFGRAARRDRAGIRPVVKDKKAG